MPFYIGGGLGPVRYYHRLGRRRPPRQGRPVRDWSPAAQRAQLAAGLLMLAVCAAVAVALVVAAIASG